jgi:hypothetical protein
MKIFAIIAFGAIAASSHGWAEFAREDVRRAQSKQVETASEIVLPALAIDLAAKSHEWTNVGFKPAASPELPGILYLGAGCCCLLWASRRIVKGHK